MTAIAVQPIILTDCKLTIGTDNYEAHVSGVIFNPASSIVTWKGLTPTSKFSFAASSTWTCQLDYAQDWETVDSLSQYLHDNEGTAVAATFEPEDGGASWGATLLIAPGAIGGQVDGVPVGSVTLGVQGKPALTPAA